MKRWKSAARIEPGAGKPRRSRLMIGALTVALIGSLTFPAAQPANAAATPVIDSYLSNISVTSFQDPNFPTHPGVNIQYNRLRTLDKSVGIQVPSTTPERLEPARSSIPGRSMELRVAAETNKGPAWRFSARCGSHSRFMSRV